MTEHEFTSDIHRVLRERRSVYKFQERSVDDAVIRRAIDCARFAPNHKMTEPWRFLQMGEKTRAALFPLVETLALAKCAKKNQSDTAPHVERALSKIRDKPLLLCVLSALTPGDDFRTREDYAATTCALHHVVLSLWSDGVGAQWSTGGITRDAQTYAALGVDAAKFEIIGFLKAGHPEKVPTTKRLSVDEIYQVMP